jgi:GMP synthase (glutamine-hydrolysing)
VLRPVNSVDGMTASFTEISRTVLRDLAINIRETLKLHVFYDITNKPPATIEWE